MPTSTSPLVHCSFMSSMMIFDPFHRPVPLSHFRDVICLIKMQSVHVLREYRTRTSIKAIEYLQSEYKYEGVLRSPEYRDVF